MKGRATVKGFEEIIKVEIDKDMLEEKIEKKLDSKLETIEVHKLFYCLDDLVAITSFSRGHIFNTFFDDPRFKALRRKVGRKWVFPVEETNSFLKQWIIEQPHE